MERIDEANNLGWNESQKNTEQKRKSPAHGNVNTEYSHSDIYFVQLERVCEKFSTCAEERRFHVFRFSQFSLCVFASLIKMAKLNNHYDFSRTVNNYSMPAKWTRRNGIYNVFVFAVFRWWRNNKFRWKPSTIFELKKKQCSYPIFM